MTMLKVVKGEKLNDDKDDNKEEDEEEEKKKVEKMVMEREDKNDVDVKKEYMRKSTYCNLEKKTIIQAKIEGKRTQD